MGMRERLIGASVGRPQDSGSLCHLMHPDNFLAHPGRRPERESETLALGSPGTLDRGSEARTENRRIR